MVCSTCAKQRRALTSAIGGDLAMPACSNQLYYSGRNLLRRIILQKEAMEKPREDDFHPDPIEPGESSAHVQDGFSSSVSVASREETPK